MRGLTCFMFFHYYGVGPSCTNTFASNLPFEKKKLFANSLEKYSDYLDTCANVGFEIVEHKDMSLDWESFTNGRLKALQANRKNHEKIHGVEGYSAIEDFYTTAAECFADNIIGGIRLICKKI